MKRLTLAVLAVVLLTGCNGWLAKPVNPRVSKVVEGAKIQKDALVSSINEINNKPTTTAQDKQLLSDLHGQLDKVDSFLADARQTIAESPTNGDLLANTAEKIATRVGGPVSIIGLIIGLLREKKTKRAYATGIANLEKHRQPDGTVNWDKLKVDNADAGINTIIKEARKKA